MPWRYCSSAAIAILLATALWPGRSIAAPPVHFDIPRGALSDALARFARQSGRQLLFAPSDVSRRRAAPVHGTIDPDRALAKLLAGSGLRARAAPGGAILLEPVPVARPAPRIPIDPDTIAPADEVAKAPDIVVVGTPGGGRRRQDAAFAVTSIDRVAIDRLAPASTADVLKLVPGLTIESSGGKNGANIFVRGYPSGGDAEYVTFQTEGVPFFPPATLSFLENSQLHRIDETVQRVAAQPLCDAVPQQLPGSRHHRHHQRRAARLDRRRARDGRGAGRRVAAGEAGFRHLLGHLARCALPPFLHRRRPESPIRKLLSNTGML